MALCRMFVADAAHHAGLAVNVDVPSQRATDAIAALLAEDEALPPDVVLLLGARPFLRLVTAEPLGCAAQGMEAARVTAAKRDRAQMAVFFHAGWRNWGV